MTEPKTRCDTLVSLRDHFDVQLIAMERSLVLARELMDQRIKLSHSELERRLHDLNRLRENTVSIPEFTSKHEALAAEYRAAEKALRAEVDALNKWIARTEGITMGKASTTAMYFAVTSGIVGLIIALIGLVHSLWT